jgi:hypothetical protein
VKVHAVMAVVLMVTPSSVELEVGGSQMGVSHAPSAAAGTPAALAAQPDSYVTPSQPQTGPPGLHAESEQMPLGAAHCPVKNAHA